MASTLSHQPPPTQTTQPPSTDSAPSLSTFLSQISAGHHSPTASGSSTTNTLPLHAQSSLIGTQLENVEKALVSLTSQRNKDIHNTIDGTTHAQVKLQRLDTALSTVSDQLHSQQGKTLASPTLIATLQAYHEAFTARHRDQLLLASLTLLKPLLQAVEDLEAHVTSGSLDPLQLQAKSDATQSLSAPFHRDGEYAWLRNANAKALVDLDDRIRDAQTKAEELAHKAWQQILTISPGQESGWSISLVQQLSITPTRSASIAEIAAALQAKGKLKQRLQEVSSKLSTQVVTYILSQDVPSVTSTSSQASPDTVTMTFATGNSHNPRASPDSFVQMVTFLGDILLQHLPSTSAQQAFSQRLLTTALPLLLAKLRQLLPAEWSGKSTQLSSELQGAASLARHIYHSLASHHFIPSDLQPESQQDEALAYPSRLLDFANRIAEIYGKKVQDSVRDQARWILLQSVEGQDSWDTEDIEVEPTVLLPADEERHRDEDFVEEMLSSDDQSRDADAWGWGDDHDGDDHAAMPRPPSASSSASSHPSASKPRGRAALGGVRVIRPQDQLGSGPFPTHGLGDTDYDDDDAWGWNDEAAPGPVLSAPSSSSSAAAKPHPSASKPAPAEDAWGFDDDGDGDGDDASQKQQQQQTVAPQPKADEEDDPWFTEQAQVTSAKQGTQQQVTPAPVQSSDTVDDDAWFADQQSSSASHIRPPSTDATSDPDPEPSVPSIAPAIPVEPSGLLSEPSSKSVVAHSTPPATTTPLPSTPPRNPTTENAASTTSTPSQVSDTSFSRSGPGFDLDDDDDDLDDAWGLSEDEKTQRRASKRASRMMMLGVPPSQQQDVPQEPESVTPTSSLANIADITPSSSLHTIAARDATPTREDAGTSGVPAVLDFDDEDDAWGLSEQEQDAKNKRASQMFGTPAPEPVQPISNQTATTDNEPLLSTVREEQPNGQSHHPPLPHGRENLTQENLEAAEAATAPHRHTNGIVHEHAPHISLPATPSEVSSISALPPSPSSSEKWTFEEDDESQLAPGNLAETSSVTSETRSDVAFPIESALPNDLQPSEVASNASLPATPRSERVVDFPSSRAASTTSSVAEAIAHQEDTDTDDEAADVRSVADSMPFSHGDGGQGAPVTENFPLHSALPLSVTAGGEPWTDAGSSVAGGPPSVASLPPTPRAERSMDLPSTEPNSGSDTDSGSLAGSNPAALPSAPSSRPYTPDVSVFAPDSSDPLSSPYTDPPFPIHSAVPYSSETGRTGPPSVASGAGSDVALPPSPFPERRATPSSEDEADSLFGSSVDGDSGFPDGEDELGGGTAGAGRHRSATATVSTVNAENLRRLSATPQPSSSSGEPSVGVSSVDEQEKLHGVRASDVEGNQGALRDTAPVVEADDDDDDDDDDDPWDDFEAQPKSVRPQETLPVQPALEEHGTIAAQREADTDKSTVEPPTVPSVRAENVQAPPTAEKTDDQDEGDEGDGWQWGEDEGATEAQNVSRASAPPPAPISTPSAAARSPASLAKRALSPSGAKSPLTSSPSNASPQLKQATLRNASAAAAAAAGAGVAAAGIAAAHKQQKDAPLPPKQKPASTAPSRPAVRMEKSKISKRSRELVNLAHKVIDDAIDLAKQREESEDGVAMPSPVPLLCSVCDIFELHRALMPVLNRKVLTEIPTLAVQFANDCQFLAKEILALQVKVQSSTSLRSSIDEVIRRNPSALDFEREAQRTTLLGKRIFETQMTLQASTLNEHLTQTDSLLRVYEDDRFANVQRVHNQVVHLISSLYSAWSSVMNESAARASIGTLIEATLQRIWKWILDLDDIGEIEGQRLAELVKMFTKLDRLFAAQGGDAPSTIVYFVPSWIKVTGYLPEILLGSLADVEFLLFEAGGLEVGHGGASGGGGEGVSKEEAKRLIRSTFADTTRRRELLSRVDRA